MFLVDLVNTLSTRMLIKNGESGQPCLIPTPKSIPNQSKLYLLMNWITFELSKKYRLLLFSRSLFFNELTWRLSTKFFFIKTSLTKIQCCRNYSFSAVRHFGRTYFLLCLHQNTLIDKTRVFKTERESI